MCPFIIARWLFNTTELKISRRQSSFYFETLKWFFRPIILSPTVTVKAAWPKWRHGSFPSVLEKWRIPVIWFNLCLLQAQWTASLNNLSLARNQGIVSSCIMMSECTNWYLFTCLLTQHSPSLSSGLDLWTVPDALIMNKTWKYWRPDMPVLYVFWFIIIKGALKFSAFRKTIIPDLQERSVQC